MSTSHGLSTQTGLQLRSMLPSPSSRGTCDPSHRSWERGPTSPSSGPASSTPPPSPTPTSRKTWSALNPFSATQPDLRPTTPTGDTTLTRTIPVSLHFWRNLDGKTSPRDARMLDAPYYTRSSTAMWTLTTSWGPHTRTLAYALGPATSSSVSPRPWRSVSPTITPSSHAQSETGTAFQPPPGWPRTWRNSRRLCTNQQHYMLLTFLSCTCLFLTCTDWCF